MAIEDIYLMDSPEISKIGKNSKNNFLTMQLLEILFISIVLLMFQLKELCNGQNNLDDQMIILRPLRKDCKHLKTKLFQLLKILKPEVTVSKLMLESQEMMFINN